LGVPLHAHRDRAFEYGAAATRPAIGCRHPERLDKFDIRRTWRTPTWMAFFSVSNDPCFGWGMTTASND